MLVVCVFFLLIDLFILFLAGGYGQPQPAAGGPTYGGAPMGML